MAETPEGSNVVQLGRAAAGTGGPYYPELDARVAKLESDVAHIQCDIAGIRGLLARLAPRLTKCMGDKPLSLLVMILSDFSLRWKDARPAGRQLPMYLRSLPSSVR